MVLKSHPIKSFLKSHPIKGLLKRPVGSKRSASLVVIKGVLSLLRRPYLNRKRVGRRRRRSN
jgi:hypothetical protein